VRVIVRVWEGAYVQEGNNVIHYCKLAPLKKCVCLCCVRVCVCVCVCACVCVVCVCLCLCVCVCVKVCRLKRHTWKKVLRHKQEHNRGVTYSTTYVIEEALAGTQLFHLAGRPKRRGRFVVKWKRVFKNWGWGCGGLFSCWVLLNESKKKWFVGKLVSDQFLNEIWEKGKGR